jgi:hypothetical protein
MIDHIESKDLDKLIISPEELTLDEREQYIKHIESCTLCNESFTKLKEFYSGLEKELSLPPTERDKSFAQKLLSRKRLALPWRRAELPARDEKALDTYYEIVEPYKRPLPQRIFRYIQLHPIKFVGATSFASIAMVLAFLLVKPTFKDNNPAFAKISNYVLSIYNKDAEVLWKKGVIGLPDQTTENPVFYSDHEYKLCLGDLNDDGKNEILIAGVNRNGNFSMDSLYCYEYDGNLIGAISAGKTITFGNPTVAQHSTLNIQNMVIMKKTSFSHSQLFVVANEIGYSPTKLFEVDPGDGHELQAYYNRGGGITLLHYDIDRDGKEEILLAGINDGYNYAYLAVLDPSRINGHAPVPEQYTPQNILPAQEKYYLMFPTTFLSKRYSGTPYNIPERVSLTKDGTLLLQIMEPLQHFPINELEAQLVYSIDSLLQIKSISAGDGFVKANDYMLKNGIIQQSLIPKYISQLKDSVLYWDGDRFLNTPTSNTRYLQKLAIP